MPFGCGTRRIVKKLLERTSWRVRFQSALANSASPLQKRTRHPFFPILDLCESSSLSWWEFFQVKILPETACTLYILQSLFWTSHREPSAWFSRNSCYYKCVTFSQGWFWRKSSLRRVTTRKKWILWWSVWFRCFSRRFLLWVAKEVDIMNHNDMDGWMMMDVFCSQDGWLTFVNLVRSIEILSIGSQEFPRARSKIIAIWNLIMVRFLKTSMKR